MRHPRMHARTAILIQASTAVAVIIFTYTALSRQPATKGRHSRGADRKRMGNLTDLEYCWFSTAIHIHLFARDAARTHRLAKALSVASHGSAQTNLTIVGDAAVIQRLEPEWPQGTYRFVTPRSISQLRMAPDDSGAPPLVMVFEDHMEPSPLYALWFQTHHCNARNHSATTVIGGGGDLASAVAGLAMTVDVWNEYVHWAAGHKESMSQTNTAVTPSIIRYLSLTPNTTIILPEIKGGSVFVRPVWQNSAYAEHDPTLMRSWDPSKVPAWGYTETKLR